MISLRNRLLYYYNAAVRTFAGVRSGLNIIEEEETENERNERLYNMFNSPTARISQAAKNLYRACSHTKDEIINYIKSANVIHDSRLLVLPVFVASKLIGWRLSVTISGAVVISNLLINYQDEIVKILENAGIDHTNVIEYIAAPLAIVASIFYWFHPIIASITTAIAYAGINLYRRIKSRFFRNTNFDNEYRLIAHTQFYDFYIDDDYYAFQQTFGEPLTFSDRCRLKDEHDQFEIDSYAYEQRRQNGQLGEKDKEPKESLFTVCQYGKSTDISRLITTNISTTIPLPYEKESFRSYFMGKTCCLADISSIDPINTHCSIPVDVYPQEVEINAYQAARAYSFVSNYYSHERKSDYNTMYRRFLKIRVSDSNFMNQVYLRFALQQFVSAHQIRWDFQ